MRVGSGPGSRARVAVAAAAAPAAPAAARQPLLLGCLGPLRLLLLQPTFHDYGRVARPGGQAAQGALAARLPAKQAPL